jgi:tRNA G46 methylase TrmB
VLILPLLCSTISTYAYSDVSLSNNRPTPVSSAQTAVHQRLPAVVQRHLDMAWRLQPHTPSVAAFDALKHMLEGQERQPLIFDSGCGTGMSTRKIAAAYPDSQVIGIDQSAHRLARAGAIEFPCRERNIIWLRAELATFWFLARQAGWTLSRHYLLYPNPWPKASHLRRRWHAHPVFPTLLELGGVLEMRCNWRVYAQEFAAALAQVCGLDVSVKDVPCHGITSAFETKYRASGMPLYQVQVDLNR